MSIRTLLFTVDSENVFPEKMQWGGVQNEHNATIVRFVLEEDFLQSLGENLKYRIDFSSDWAGYDPSENLTYDDYVEREIPRKFTQDAGKMQAVLVISKVIDNEAVEEFISIPVEIFFTPAERKSKRVIENLSAYEEYVSGLVAEIDKNAEIIRQNEGNASLSAEKAKISEEVSVNSASIASEHASSAAINADRAQQQVQIIAQKVASGEFKGKDGVDGKDYILTDADKIEIAEFIINNAFVDVSEVAQ